MRGDGVQNLLQRLGQASKFAEVLPQLIQGLWSPKVKNLSYLTDGLDQSRILKVLIDVPGRLEPLNDKDRQRKGWRNHMAWTAPEFVEIQLNCEINSYASAKL